MQILDCDDERRAGRKIAEEGDKGLVDAVSLRRLLRVG